MDRVGKSGAKADLVRIGIDRFFRFMIGKFPYQTSAISSLFENEGEQLMLPLIL